MSEKNRILVIIPAYHEEENIAKTINEVKEKAPYVDILVVDDGSQDETAKIAGQLNVMVVSLPFNLRIGGAVQTGFKMAKMLGYDIAIQVDADGQHDPSYISQLTKPIDDGKADISIGSRYLHYGNVNCSLSRRVGIQFFSWLATKITGCRITDCSSGFRALNRNAIDFFADEYPVDFPDAEALILAHRVGLEIAEVPVRFHDRNSGESSLYFWRFLWYPVKEIFSILMLLTKRQGRIK